MSTRPVRKIFPTAKLTADNAGELELASHRRAIAASVPFVAPQPKPPATSSPLPESSPESPPPLTDVEDDSSPAADLSQTRSSSKRPSQDVIKSLHSHDSIITVSSTASDDAPDTARKFKKSKTAVSSGAQDAHSDVSVINIDDIGDPEDERLNRSEPTADIKHFFTILACLPGQTKRRMKCNLCA
ncbi:hypothetical protein EDB89DRAFT_1905937 [Lactarius sanguifluus]|nr:hypothetical protein EDB89DRAFT_1910418 [Lactarius sanguifluus]KAH9171603.1 hypothetical protein EDB89DRAFT_2070712 [Lactarius sanguifluus]KAH9172604.1 hypothetical protein EDB89DRAFT_1905919 [Lactarius sanguifluus]KAH9172622.1 hypothetical protein EDB89DRAFT_1905937 [Lactarius sanguifluus]